MKKYITQAIKSEASDLFLVTGRRPSIRVYGELSQLEGAKVTDKQIKDFFIAKLSSQQKTIFEEMSDLDFRLVVDGVSARVNLHRQHDGLAVAIRLLPREIPLPDEIFLPEVVKEIVNEPHGLVLVTGPSGTGKSTTIASLIQKINKTRSEHIITVEDPIEYPFDDEMSLIEQREVSVDTPAFDTALRHVLRQNPDIIYVGEMRDRESVAATLTAAETGHLVFSTLHTRTAADTVERIIDLFPPEKQRQILVQLASVLRMVVTQVLLPRKDGKGLVAAREILINTPAVANLIRNNNIFQINSAIQTGKKLGMQTMEQAMAEMADEGLIDSSLIKSKK